jgi:TetR/AcrR family fatty acid metabolism transcriptional regulator
MEDRRRQILDAALQVFAREGYATATIHDVAHTARVAEGTIYNYFRNKDDLLVHIPRHVVGGVFDDLANRLAEVQTPAEAERALAALGHEMVRRVRANLKFVRVFFSALPHLSASARREYLRLLPLAVADVLEAHLRQGMAAGLYRSDLHAATAARALPILMFVSVAINEVFGDGEVWQEDYETIVRENVRLFLTGALGRERRATGGSA